MVKEKKDLSKEIVKKIKAEKVKMRPKIYFILGSVLLGIGVAGALLFSIIFTNRAFFRLRVFGPFGNLAFGKAGIGPFLSTFPFISLALALIGIGGGLYLLRRYEFSYKRSLISLLIGVAALVVTVGFVLDQVGFGERVRSYQPLTQLYSYKTREEHLVVGEVKATEGDILTVVTPEGDEVEIVFGENTEFPSGSDFKEGDRVRAVGEWESDTFIAKGISKGGLRWRTIETPESAPGPRVRGKTNIRPGLGR